MTMQGYFMLLCRKYPERYIIGEKTVAFFAEMLYNK